jgi:hypothetical protein
MKVYTVHLPDSARPGDVAGLDRAIFVRDGFHWLAAVLPLLWLLANRIWLGFLAVLAATVAIGALAATNTIGPAPVVALELCLAVFVGVCAADLKGWSLRRRGLPAVDVVSGRDAEEAERRFFDRWLDAGPAAARPGVARLPVTAMPTGTPQVLGLFPEAGASR